MLNCCSFALTNFREGEELFTFVMVGSSCLMCWGTLATTFDTLALLGIVQVRSDRRP